MTRPDASHGGTMVTQFFVAIVSVVLWSAVVWADEAPIAGTVKAVDAGAQTVTLESTAKGKTRQVVVHLKPGTKIVKFVRSSEPGRPGSSSRRSAWRTSSRAGSSASRPSTRTAKRSPTSSRSCSSDERVGARGPCVEERPGYAGERRGMEVWGPCRGPMCIRELRTSRDNWGGDAALAQGVAALTWSASRESNDVSNRLGDGIQVEYDLVT
jgi:hypothetical protein